MTKMILTPEEQDMLDGKKGQAMAKVMKTLIMYGETFGAEKMVPVTSDKGHLVTSFGLKALGPVYRILDQLIAEGAISQQPFSVDPRPYDPKVPANFIEKIVFKNFMYSRQCEYEQQLGKLGLMNEDAFTCAAYLDEVGNEPKPGEVLSWAESSAVVYANSVLGARCNRNSGIIELFGSIAGRIPYFGFLTDEGRKATWIVEVKTTKKPEAQVLGSAIGIKVQEDVPYIKGLSEWIGTEINTDNKGYLKDMGAATASNGAVGLYHVENLTPEAKELGDGLLADNVQTYVIDDAELQRVQDSYPVIWSDPNAKPKMCFIGCPHLTFQQLIDWTNDLTSKLNGKKVVIPTVMTTAPAVLKHFKTTEYAKKLEDTGVILSSICPLMYMNNPLCGKKPVITCSNKLRTYTSSRYYTNEQISDIITGRG